MHYDRCVICGHEKAEHSDDHGFCWATLPEANACACAAFSAVECCARCGDFIDRFNPRVADGCRACALLTLADIADARLEMP